MSYVDSKTFKVHQEITVPKVEQRSFECDDLIAPVISILNLKGYKTNFCCAGHPYPNYEDMYILLYEDTNEAYSSTMGHFFPKKEFFTDAPTWKKVEQEEIPEEHQFDDIEIDDSRPHNFYYVETDNHIFGSLAYISFLGDYFDEDELPIGWDLYETEYYDPEKGEFSTEVKNTIIQFSFDFNQDVYYFYTQQVSTFMILYEWAKNLPDLTK